MVQGKIIVKSDESKKARFPWLSGYHIQRPLIQSFLETNCGRPIDV